MRSICRIMPRLSLALACAAVVALCALPRAHAAPANAGAVGGAWQIVDAPPLSGQRITALAADGRGGLWVGSEERGLAHWDGQAWRTVGPRDGLPDSRVVALLLDRQHRLWVSTGGGLGYLPPDGGPFRRIGLAGLRTLPILAFAQARDGSILLGGTGGLALWQADGALQVVPELRNLHVLALHAARDGAAWAGTSAGLWHEVDGKWVQDDSVGDSRIAAIAEGPDGRLYAAGENGLWQMSARGWRRSAAPLKGDITSIAVRDGSIWVGASQGLVAGQDDVWEAYDPGLLPEASVTALAWGSDDLWVATTGGLVAYRPDSSPPKVYIVRVNGRGPDAGSLNLADDRVERIEIGLSDRGTPEHRLRVFTRLEGVDPAPRLLTEAERRDLASSSIYAGRRLPPGSYVLRVWAQDDAFNRSAESQVTVVVPSLARGPAGLTVRQDVAYAGFGGVALILTAGATTLAAGKTRRRRAQHAADAAAARVRAVADRSVDLYSERLPVRQEQVGEVVDAVQRQNVLLLGPRGMGKTSTLAQVMAALPTSGSERLIAAPARLDLAALHPQELFYALMTAATDALAPFIVGPRPRLRWSEGARTEYGEQEFTADLGVLLTWLQSQLTRRLILVFLLDNADVLDGYGGRERDGFRRLLVAASGPASPIRLALAAEATPAVVDGFADLFHTVVLAPLAPPAAAQLLRDGTRGLLGWEPEAERAGVARGGGSPARLAALGRAAARAALLDNRLTIAGSDVP